jgi:peptidoglycan hydrolase CwlO-like protein
MTMTGLLIILTQQILDAAKLGSHKPNTFTNWIKSYPTGKPITVSMKGSGGCVVGGKANISVSIAANATIETKVDFLLSQVTALNSSLTKLDDRVDNINLTLNKTERKFQASLDTLSTSLNGIIASHIVGSYDLNLLGINITICGTVIQFFSS